MTNKEIAAAFKQLGDLMELHLENKFKIRSYQNAYITLRKIGQPLEEMTDEDINSIKGVGKAIAGKIRELVDIGTMSTLEKYNEVTPEGIREMLKIKGFGPKKVRVIWKDLEVETIGELLYACNENRLIELKGFGQKTQADLLKTLEYYLRTKDHFHYASLEEEAEDLVENLQNILPDCKISLTGEIRRKSNVLPAISILIGGNFEPEVLFQNNLLIKESEFENGWSTKSSMDTPVQIYYCSLDSFGSKLFRYSSSKEFLTAFVQEFPDIDFRNQAEEASIFEKAQLPYIVPELREHPYFIQKAQEGILPDLIEENDIKGVVHNHSTYSDGLHSLEEMASYTQSQGYQYLVISDHSKSAFYANGLKEDRLFQQWEEIDMLNQKMAPFHVFKGIESDILSDGSLDYSDELLSKFDCIIASIHSNLKMEESKANQRLVKAIENPFTNILGHPTGRLLLSRKGYPIDHKLIIDACASNGVSIELNANPYRLDLDWSWIPYAMEKEVLISINPDAHSKEGIHHIHYGVVSARKGGLTAQGCLNTRNLEEFRALLQS